MSTKNLLCGMECEFSKLTEIWEFFNFPGIHFGTGYFSVADAAVYSKGKRIALPSEFGPSFFQELIQCCFVCERLVLQLYPANSPTSEIDSYTDYIQSNCKMVILMCDCYYLEIYCKDHVWLQTLLHTAKEMPGVIVKEKYEDTDPRTRMYV